jgi:hypothetical protein
LPSIRRERHWTAHTRTKLREDEYYQLIDKLQRLLPPGAPFWTIEEYWTAGEDNEA